MVTPTDCCIPLLVRYSMLLRHCGVKDEEVCARFLIANICKLTYSIQTEQQHIFANHMPTHTSSSSTDVYGRGCQIREWLRCLDEALGADGRGVAFHSQCHQRPWLVGPYHCLWRVRVMAILWRLDTYWWVSWTEVYRGAWAFWRLVLSRNCRSTTTAAAENGQLNI